MVAAVKKGRSVNEAEIPPPLAIGASQRPPAPSESAAPEGESEPTSPTTVVTEIVEPGPEGELSSSASVAPLSELPSPGENTAATNDLPQENKTEGKSAMDFQSKGYLKVLSHLLYELQGPH